MTALPSREPDELITPRPVHSLMPQLQKWLAVGYGWEDVRVKLRKQGIVIPIKHLRRFWLSVPR